VVQCGHGPRFRVHEVRSPEPAKSGVQNPESRVKVKLRSRHLLGIEDLDRSEILTILDQARTFREVLDRPIPIVPALRGRTVVNLFFEASTRTTTSFSLAASRLSCGCVNFSKATSAVSKGETLLDTARNIEAMGVDGIIIRHASPGAPHFLSRHVKAFVVNAGDGAHEHPTQALLDAFTLREKLGSLDGKRVLMVGDITHSRVARSNLLCFSKLGARVAVCGPPTMIPPDIEQYGCEVFYRLDRILDEVDVVNMLRVQQERITSSSFPTVREYRAFYGLTAERLRNLAPEVVVTHPGPVNWGVEMDFDVAEFSRALVLPQVTNGVAVRMAVLFLLAGGEGEVRS